MRATIDKAGRVVIPAPIRARLGLTGGTEVEIEIDDFALRLVPRIEGPRLEKSGGRWVARPVVPEAERPEIEPAALIAEERDRWPG